MTQGDRTKAGLLMVVVAVASSACSGGSNPASTAAPTTHPAARTTANAGKKGPTVAEQTVGMVSAVTLGKSTVPVALKFDLAAKPRVGVPLAINLAVLPQIAADGGKVSVLSADGFEPLPAGAASGLDALAADEVYRRTIRVTPAKAGVLLLTLALDLTHDEITETRQFIVPVLVEEQSTAK